MVFVASNEAAEIVKPSKESFHAPTSFASPKWSSILSDDFSAFSVWGNQLNPSLLPESLVESIAVIGFVANEPVRQFIDEALVKRLFDEPDFVGRSILNADGERKTSAVCNCHDLGPFTALRLTNSKAPFFAPEKEPSTNPSSKSNLPRARRS